MNQNDGGPAFPAGTNDIANVLLEKGKNPTGMTLRDYFAANSMMAWIVNPHRTHSIDHSEIAGFAYATADAMLKARESNVGPTK